MSCRTASTASATTACLPVARAPTTSPKRVAARCFNRTVQHRGHHHRHEPSRPSCPCCGGRMIIIETFQRGCPPRYRPALHHRDQDRHIMISTVPGDIPCSLLLRRLSTGHDQARRRAPRHPPCRLNLRCSTPVPLSRSPTELVSPSTAYRTAAQRTPATDRRSKSP